MFLDELRAYLESLQSPPAFTPDIAAHRRRLVEGLEELQRAGASKKRIEQAHRFWSPRLAPFVERMGAELLNGIANGQSSAEVARAIDVAIERQLDLSSSLGSLAKDLELDRISEIAKSALTVKFTDLDSKSGALLVPVYAVEIRATKRSGGGQALTPIGRLILDLPDRDALRWVLTVEAVQSRGRDDTFRLSRTSAAELLQVRKITFPWDDRTPWPVTWETLERLSRMGLAHVRDDEDAQLTSFELLPEGRPILHEIATSPNAPFAVLATALLQDETSAAIGNIRPAAAMIQSEGASAALARHARMVAHEVRNALVPVQATLNTLYRDVERKGDSAVVAKHRGLIDGNIERIFQFIEQIVDVAERGVEPAELFEIEPAIKDAIVSVSIEIKHEVPLLVEGELPLVRGARSRFVLAIVNLLRNAAQAQSDRDIAIQVVAKAAVGGAEAVIMIDDSGPGVPLEHRKTIFEQGFTLRPGGTGQGLALVREVIESEMHGRVECVDNPHGGARFMLTIPAGGGKNG
jgi:signal transduction histidine kinase